MSSRKKQQSLKEAAIERRNELLSTARVLIKTNNFYILDTETTGLGADDEIVELVMFDPSEMKPVFDSLIRPAISIPVEATQIHGITNDEIRNDNVPTFHEVYGELEQIFSTDKQIVIYNKSFDLRLLEQSRKTYGLPPFAIEDDQDKVVCAMELFAAHVGEWVNYRNDFKWQKLPGAGHRALDDCIATLNVLRRVAFRAADFQYDMLCGQCGCLKGLYLDHWGYFSFCQNCGDFRVHDGYEQFQNECMKSIRESEKLKKQVQLEADLDALLRDVG